MAAPARIASPASLGRGAVRLAAAGRTPGPRGSGGPEPAASAARSSPGQTTPAAPSHGGQRPRPRPRDQSMPKRYFNPSPLQEVGQADPGKPPDENKVKLGKTLRILQERLPTLLQSPLPQDILAPNISLHLFPSTHPHLPTVSGRVAYTAALWTSPIAWNRLPIVGDVRLEILSERVVKELLPFAPRRAGAIDEQLVVRWCSRSGGQKNGGEAAAGAVGGREETDTAARQFTGLFVFQFDGDGRILSHTIEHVQESGNWEKGVGATFVGLTDWLLGGFKGRGGEGDTAPPLPVCQRLKTEGQS